VSAPRDYLTALAEGRVRPRKIQVVAERRKRDGETLVAIVLDDLLSILLDPETAAGIGPELVEAAAVCRKAGAS
jgi:hypothetical protein